MQRLQKNILDISHNHYKYLMNLENVNGVGVGFKRINGITTKELCIHVLVEKKVNKNLLTSNNVIPKVYMGIRTDVIEVGESKFLSSPLITQKFRPLKSGCGISVVGHQLAGTLGLFVTKRKFLSTQYFILSSNHVLAGLNKVPIGTPILQPIDLFGGIEEEDRVAELSTFVHLKFIENEKEEPANLVDCAIARIKDKSIISNVVISIGRVTEIGDLVLNMKIKKVGFSTGLTEGTVDTIGVSKYIKIKPNKRILFKSQISANIKVEGGDSGSIVLNDKNQVIALVMSGNPFGNATLNDINHVLNELDVKIYEG